MSRRTALLIYVLIIALVWVVIVKAAPIQGDCDQNGQVDISDAVCIINAIFLGIEPPRLEWWERDTTSTLFIFDGRTYRMADHNIEAWKQFVIAGNDTGVVTWYRIGESIGQDSTKIAEVK